MKLFLRLMHYNRLLCFAFKEIQQDKKQNNQEMRLVRGKNLQILVI